MKPKHIWAKANLVFTSSTSTSSGPFWIGVDLDTAAALGCDRWDIPAGYSPLREAILEAQQTALQRDIATARTLKKPAVHRCYARPALSLRRPALTTSDDGQFGRVLDAALVATLDTIEPSNMSWITTPDRERLHETFARLTADHIDQLIWAVHKSGLPVTLCPAEPIATFDSIQLCDAA